MRSKLFSAAAAIAGFGLLTACGSLRTPPPSFPEAPSGTPGAPGTAQPQPGTPTPVTPEESPRPPPKQFKLGPASTALVAQAHTQANSGNYEPAAATLERALRIEPENPLLWIELGRVRMSEGNNAQADSLGRKALALATGDPQAQASAWHLIADSLKARGRNQEAADAEKRAGAPVPR